MAVSTRKEVGVKDAAETLLNFSIIYGANGEIPLQRPLAFVDTKAYAALRESDCPTPRHFGNDGAAPESKTNSPKAQIGIYDRLVIWKRKKTAY
jgi:hypothetical protein